MSWVITPVAMFVVVFVSMSKSVFVPVLIPMFVEGLSLEAVAVIGVPLMLFVVAMLFSIMLEMTFLVVIVIVAKVLFPIVI